MALHNHLFDSLRESTSRVWTPNSNAFDLRFAQARGGWRTVADFIETNDPGKTIYLPDANVGILPETEDVWTRCRLAALSLDHPKVILTSPVYHEWIDKAKESETRAQTIRNALEQGSWIGFFDLDQQVDQEYFKAFAYYLRLLAARRAVAIPVTEGGRTVEELMNDVVTKIGSRGIGLTRKGRLDKQKKGYIDVNDEAHVLSSIWFALKYKRQVCILTSDMDCLEIFHKAVEVIHRQFVSFLSAYAVHTGHYGNPAAKLSDDQSPFFTSPVALYSPKYDDCRDLFPGNTQSVSVDCIYVHNNAEVYQVGAMLDYDVDGLLCTKGKTRGLNSDLFQSSNIHLLDINPAHGTSLAGKYIAIGADQALEVEEMGVKVRLGLFDVLNTVNCGGEFRQQWFPQFV